MTTVIVVGGGASAVQAAWPLVSAGHDVVMIAPSIAGNEYGPLIPDGSFEEIRRSDPVQHQYLLGHEFEGIPLGRVGLGAQLTPPRQYIGACEGSPPIDVPEGFSLIQSMALGGLAQGWGAASPCYTDDDLRGWPITRRNLQPHYDAVARRVGICGREDDDLAPFMGPSPFLLPPARIDDNAVAILRRYRRRRESFHRRGFFLGEARLAMATAPIRGRGPLRYLDMEFWADKDRAVYRPVYTIEELRRYSNFRLETGLVAETFQSLEGGGVRLRCRSVESTAISELKCDTLILAAGAIGTGKIVLASQPDSEAKLPLLSNPYVYYPCLVYTRLGRATRDRRHSLTQLMAFLCPANSRDPVVQVQFYSYRSLLTFKLLKESRLPQRESLALFRMLQSYFVIAGVHHSDCPEADKFLKLEKKRADAPTTLAIHYRRSHRARESAERAEGSLRPLLRKLGCLPLGRIDPGDGASIHYAGTVPMSEVNNPLTARPDGSLRDAPSVYIADASLFPTLPAKGLTFTAMALADRVGVTVLRNLRGRR